ncbi:uncharacterized protein LOC131633093 [Vicia villosa]|uniref:uncharacterized protein LOC131633093 n=1 Tax=Vicia villosa TaxID=3911 RepID=UPI00273BC5BD|nr:uncharacterized protein LOC131633093 [Vicia villosa]
MAPPRVKHLLWRICRGCLPSRIRLRQHYVQCTPECPVCEDMDEEDWHVFFGCSTIIQCWRAAGLSSIIEPRLQHFSDAKSLIFYVCSREDRRDAGRFAMMVEVIWKNRNNIVWNNEREDMSRLGLQAYVNWQDWFTAQVAQERSNNTHLPVVWFPPVDNWVKCNVDVGFNSAYRSTNRGWCFRDKLGRFITAGTAWDIGSMSTIEAEAIALKEAVQHAISLNLNFVIFESDSQLVVQGIHSNVSGLSEFNLILLSIKRLLALIPNFEVKFIKRQANMVADTLVKAANS